MYVKYNVSGLIQRGIKYSLQLTIDIK